MKFSLSFGKRLAFFACITLFCYVVTALVVGFIGIKFGVDSSRWMRVAAVLQDLLLFIIPALVTALVITRLPATFLCIDRPVNVRMLLLAVFAMIFSIPAMNALIAWNQELQLPEALSGLAEQMMAAEKAAQHSIEVLLGGHSVMSLVVSILIVGILAGFSEELFFRGALMRLFTTGRMNPHLAVWLTAFIFSAIHMQFYGFFPRFLLGAFFGYMLLWSGSLWLPVVLHALNNTLYVVENWINGPHAADAAADASASVTSFFGFGPVLSIILSVVLTAYFLWRAYGQRFSSKA